MHSRESGIAASTMKPILRIALPCLAMLALVPKALAIVSQVLHDLDWAPEYVIVATEMDVTQNCQTRPSVVFNGTSPGPPIFLMEGQTTWVRAYNHMADKNLTIVSFPWASDFRSHLPGKPRTADKE